jgi:hypothetical protein
MVHAIGVGGDDLFSIDSTGTKSVADEEAEVHMVGEHN